MISPKPCGCVVVSRLVYHWCVECWLANERKQAEMRDKAKKRGSGWAALMGSEQVQENLERMQP